MGDYIISVMQGLGEAMKQKEERFLKTRSLEYRNKSHKLELYLDVEKLEEKEKKLH